MKFTKLELQNFLGIGSATVRLDEQGLVLVQGENLDDPSQNSNGSGKSTLADGLFWCLYGSTARDLKGDAVVNTNVGKNCFARVKIVDGDNTYVVERWRKMNHNGKRSGLAVYRYDEDAPVDLSKGTDKLTQEVVNTIVGSSETVFKSAVYAAQEAMPDIPSMTDRALKELVEEAAGIDLIEDAYSIARQRLKEADAALGDATSEEEAACQRLGMAEEQYEDIEDAIKEWENSQANRVERIKANITDIIADAKKIAAQRDRFDLKAISDEEAKIEARIAKIDKKITGQQDERREERKLQDELAHEKTELRSLNMSRSAHDNDLVKIKKEITKVNDRIGTPCGECGKPIKEADLKAVLENLKEREDKIVSAIIFVDSAIEDCEAQVKMREKKLTDFQARMTDVSSVVGERNELTDQLKSLTQSVAEYQRCQDSLDHKKRSARDLKQQLEDAAKEKNPNVDRLRKAADKIDTIKGKLKDIREQTKELEQTVRVAKTVVEVFGPKGVRAYIIDTVTPFLNERTAHYLGTMSDGMIEATWSTITLTASGEARENFKIEVAKKGAGTSFKALSGGEKRKVRLACALSLQDLVASRADKPINLWIGDEIDDALDDAGLERLMNVLEDKAREKGTVLIVSHRSLRDWVREVVTVTMEGGKASVDGALSAV